MRSFVLTIVYLGTVVMIAKPHVAMKRGPDGDENSDPTDLLEAARRQPRGVSDSSSESDGRLSPMTTDNLISQATMGEKIDDLAAIPDDSIQTDIERMKLAPIRRRIVKVERNPSIVASKNPAHVIHWSDGKVTLEKRDNSDKIAWNSKRKRSRIDDSDKQMEMEFIQHEPSISRSGDLSLPFEDINSNPLESLDFVANLERASREATGQIQPIQPIIGQIQPIEPIGQSSRGTSRRDSLRSSFGRDKRARTLRSDETMDFDYEDKNKSESG